MEIWWNSMKNILIFVINLLISCLYLFIFMILINKVHWFKTFIDFFINLFKNPKIGVIFITTFLGFPLALILKFINEKIN